MIHLELVFIGDVRFRLKFIFCLCMLNSTLFIKENIISPLNCFCAYSKISSPYLYGSLYFPLICVSIFLLIPHCLDYCSFMVGVVIPSVLFLFFKIILAILVPLHFYINFRLSLFISIKISY